MAASAVYKSQARVSGSFRGGIPHCKVAGKWKNPKSVYAKISGHWRLSYSGFTWYYYWEAGAYAGCSGVGSYNVRPVWCKFNPEGTIVADAYCDPNSKPAVSYYCHCNCACACCCC